MTTRTKQDLEAAVKAAKNALKFAEQELQDFERSPENFRYDSLEEAGELEDELLERAAEDCEGSYNLGDDMYSQEFYVGTKKYVAVLDHIFYNRHAKRYYYVDGHEFHIEELDD